MQVSYLQSTDTGISMTIESDTDISIARMLMNLENVDVLTNLTIPSVAAVDAEDGTTKYDFSITADYVSALAKEQEAAQNAQ